MKKFIFITLFVFLTVFPILLVQAQPSGQTVTVIRAGRFFDSAEAEQYRNANGPVIPEGLTGPSLRSAGGTPEDPSDVGKA